MFIFALLSIAITVSIVVILLRESLLFFESDEVTLSGFLFGTKWQPMIGYFGVLPLLNATLMTSLIAMIVALPLGLAVGIYLSEYADEKFKSVVKPVLEVLAGIPSIVYGYFALTFMTPLLRSIFGDDVVQMYNMMSAGIVMGILILPLVATMAEDAIAARPGGTSPRKLRARRHDAGDLDQGGGTRQRSVACRPPSCSDFHGR